MSKQKILEQSKIIIKKEKLRNNKIINKKSLSCSLGDNECKYNLNGEKGTIKKKQILKGMFNLDNNKNIVDQILDAPLNITTPHLKVSDLRDPLKHIENSENNDLIDFNIFTQHKKPSTLKNLNLMNILTQHLNKSQKKGLIDQFGLTQNNFNDDILQIDLNKPVCNIRQPNLSEILVPVSQL